MTGVQTCALPILPVIDAQWSGKKHTDAEFEAMKELEADITLRFRAFG